MEPLKSRISGTGSYAPKKVIKNTDLERILDTTDEWITTRTGIRERRVAAGEKSSDLAAKAANGALKAAGLRPKDIDLVVTGTVTPDMVFPSTSCFVQMELGLRPGIPAFDVTAACSGFLYALDVADKFITTGAAKNALVIGVDIFSRIVDWTDRSTCVLFGDGAGAVVLTGSRGKSGVLSSNLYSDGRSWQMLYTPGPDRPNPFEKAAPKQGPACLQMKGNETFKLAVRSMGSAVADALKQSRLKPEDVSLLIPHQANIRIIKAMQERMKLTDDQVFSNIDRYGNTSAGSIPLALDEAVRGGRVKKGDVVVFVAFGGGLTWASTIVRW